MFSDPFLFSKITGQIPGHGLNRFDEAVDSFHYQTFTEPKMFRYFKKIFEKNGLVIDSLEISKKPRRVEGYSVTDVTVTLEDGLKLFLLVTFETDGKSSIDPNARGILFGAALGKKDTGAIPFSREKNADLPWDEVLKIILDEVKVRLPKFRKAQQRRLETKSQATDGTGPESSEPKKVMTFAKQIEAKKRILEKQTSLAAELKTENQGLQEAIGTRQQSVQELKTQIEAVDQQIASITEQLKALTAA